MKFQLKSENESEILEHGTLNIEHGFPPIECPPTGGCIETARARMRVRPRSSNEVNEEP